MINFKNVNQNEVIQKPWGNEVWIQPGSDVHPYVLKKILLLSGHRTSLQYHKHKSETIYILSGRGEMVYSNETATTENYSDKLLSMPLEPGMSIVIDPYTIHRVIAFEDLEYVEASTTQLSDIVRLEDDTGRVSK